MNEAAHLLDFFFLDEVERIEVLDFGGDGAGETRGIETCDLSHAALTGEQIRPDFSTGISHRANEAQTSDDNSTTQAYLPPFACALM